MNEARNKTICAYIYASFRVIFSNGSASLQGLIMAVTNQDGARAIDASSTSKVRCRSITGLTIIVGKSIKVWGAIFAGKNVIVGNNIKMGLYSFTSTSVLSSVDGKNGVTILASLYKEDRVERNVGTFLSKLRTFMGYRRFNCDFVNVICASGYNLGLFLRLWLAIGRCSA